MKHLLLKCLLFSIALLYSAPKIAAQEISELKVSAAYRGQSLKLILLDYEINYRLKFDYEEAQIAPFTVVANFKRKSLEEGLTILLDSTGLGFNYLSERRIAIVPQAEVKVESGNSSYTPTAFNFPVSGRVKDKNTGETLPLCFHSSKRYKQGNFD